MLEIEKIKIRSLSLELSLELFVGRKHQCLGSKSRSDPLTIHNANMVVGDRVIWYGDINVPASKKVLMSLASLYEVTIELYFEHGIREFFLSGKAKREKHKENIAKEIPIWTTANPDKWGEQEWWEAFFDSKERQQRHIRDSKIGMGYLTPVGSEWHWYNKPFYKLIYPFYAIPKGWFRYGWNIASWKRYKWYKKPFVFTKYFLKDGYEYLRYTLPLLPDKIKKYYWETKYYLLWKITGDEEYY